MLKKVVLSLVLLSAVAAVASAQTDPYSAPMVNRVYDCTYSGPTGVAANPGASVFAISKSWLLGAPIWRGIEYFDALHNGQPYTENRKVTFAKPVNLYSPYYGEFTRWEFTINPDGPQCKAADVLFYGYTLRFTNCTDGHTRTCNLRY